MDLETPDLLTFDYVTCYLTQEGIYMVKTLCIKHKGNVMVAAGELCVEEQWINVAFE